MSNASFKVGAVWASKAMSEVRNSADVESGALLPSLSASNEAIRYPSIRSVDRDLREGDPFVCVSLRVHAAAKFPRATVRDFNAASRNVFRHCLAESLSLPSSQVHVSESRYSLFIWFLSLRKKVVLCLRTQIAGVAADREDKALGVEFQVGLDTISAEL